MISYMKLYGPPIFDSLKELQKIAVDMPEVCIMDTMISYSIGVYSSAEDLFDQKDKRSSFIRSAH